MLFVRMVRPVVLLPAFVLLTLLFVFDLRLRPVVRRRLWLRLVRLQSLRWRWMQLVRRERLQQLRNRRMQ